VENRRELVATVTDGALHNQFWPLITVQVNRGQRGLKIACCRSGGFADQRWLRREANDPQ
jgi:hypothetical protein